MKDIIFKVALPGEGKTRWLLDIANMYHNSGKNVYLSSECEGDYVKFCEKYFSLFHEVCPVARYTEQTLNEDCIVLIDNLLNQNFSTKELCILKSKCYRLFITLEGCASSEGYSINLGE